MECPNCKSHDVRRSIRQGLREGLLLRAILRAPYRCRQCGTRFWSRSHHPEFPQRKKHRNLAAFFGIRDSDRKKFNRGVLILFLCLIMIILAIYLFLPLVESGPPGNVSAP